MSTREAVIVGAVRTPVGKRYGSLSGWHPVELAAAVLAALQERTGIDPAIVDDVIMGCVTQVGPQSTNIGRNAVLAAGWPESVPATTVDRQCGSSQQAVHFAAQGIMAGSYDVAVAAGVEAMTSVPMFSNAGGDLGSVYPSAMVERYADRDFAGQRGLVNQGISAEMIAADWGLTRAELDALALASHERAAAARDAGQFTAETFALRARVRDKETGEVSEPGTEFAVDECIRDTSAEKLAALSPAFLPDGVITAGNSSQIVDGAAGLVLMSREKAAELGLRPRAAVRQLSVVGDDPVRMLTGPIPATHRALERAGLPADAIDAFEVNEAFASVVVAWQREFGVDPERLNPRGGGISLGHPLGASGARLMTTLLHHLEQTGGRYGLQTMCEGGGMANATIIEVLA